MKRILAFIAAAVLSFSASAQGLVVGEKIPDFRVKEWMGQRKPTPAPHKMMLVEFFHSSNSASAKRLTELGAWAKEYPISLTIVVIAKEDTPELRKVLRETSALYYVGFDDAGKTFGAFGVQYVPYGVLTDPKGRVLWMGNSTDLTTETIENHIEHGIYKDRPLRKTPQGGKGR